MMPTTETIHFVPAMATLESPGHMHIEVYGWAMQIELYMLSQDESG